MDAASVVGRATAPDGVELRTRHWPRLASDPEPWAAVLLVHGLGEHSGRYEHVGRWLTAGGLDVHAYDQRGFGGSGGRRAYVDRWSQLHDDLAARLDAVRAVSPDLPLVVYGHSLGGLVSLGYVLTDRPVPDRLVLSGPAIDAAVPASRRLAVKLLGSLTPTLAVTSGVGEGVLSRDPTVEEAFRADPLSEHRTTLRFGQEGFAEQDRILGRIGRLDLPTLVIHGGDDGYVPASASEVLEANPRVTRRVYPGLRHELHNEPEGREVIDDVIAWLEAGMREVRTGLPAGATTAGGAPAVAALEP
jgi:alpha-beta hydrolase superfamily lysophospholipase